jgi:hypothetical protein
MNPELIILTAPPQDGELLTRITKLAEYVTRNGVEFEEKVKAKEAGNENFAFLFGGPYALYYKWYLAAYRRNLTPEQINSIETNHRDQLTTCLPGFIDLTSEDKEELSKLLIENSGSKESIKGLRKWILERAHSACAIGIQIRLYASSLKSVNSSANFNKLLHTLYVLNDVFYSMSGGNTRGPYTELMLEGKEQPVDFIACIWPQVPLICWTAYTTAGDDSSGKSRLEKVIELWNTKEFIDIDKKNSLLADMINTNPPSQPPIVNLMSPYLKLPPVMPPQLSIPPPPLPHQLFANINTPQALMSGQFPIPGAIGNINSFAPGMGALHPSQFPAFVLQAPPPPPPPVTPILDVQKTSVGSMANIVRQSLKLGQKKYSPIDVSLIAQIVPPTVEPGRLEVIIII